MNLNDSSCICDTPLNILTNTHNDKRDIDLILKDKGIVIFENKLAIATFDFNFCPICGKCLI